MSVDDHADVNVSPQLGHDWLNLHDGGVAGLDTVAILEHDPALVDRQASLGRCVAEVPGPAMSVNNPTMSTGLAQDSQLGADVPALKLRDVFPPQHASECRAAAGDMLVRENGCRRNPADLAATSAGEPAVGDAPERTDSHS